MKWKLVAGLGNPGAAYVRTPHNAGFEVVDLLAARLGAVWRTQARFKAMVARVRYEGTEVMLAKPQTFMNLSGEAVGSLLNYHGIAPDDLVVVSDDADLPVGRLRIRAAGSSGGHRGLISVIDACGTQAFARVRVGVGRGEPGRDLVGHVLGRLDQDNDAALRRTLETAADAVLCLVARGVDEAMNCFNGWDATDADRPDANERG